MFFHVWHFEFACSKSFHFDGITVRNQINERQFDVFFFNIYDGASYCSLDLSWFAICLEKWLKIDNKKNKKNMKLYSHFCFLYFNDNILILYFDLLPLTAIDNWFLVWKCKCKKVRCCVVLAYLCNGKFCWNIITKKKRNSLMMDYTLYHTSHMLLWDIPRKMSTLLYRIFFMTCICEYC